MLLLYRNLRSLIFLITWQCFSKGEETEQVDSCFTVDYGECSKTTDDCKCNFISAPNSEPNAFCCNITSTEDLAENFFKCIDLHGVTALHIRDSKISRLDMDVFLSLNELSSLSITNCTITSLYGRLDSPATKLNCLNFSDNLLQDFNANAWEGLNTLRRLVIANTNMTVLPKLSPSIDYLTLDISNNTELPCTSMMEFVSAILPIKNYRFLNDNSTFCNTQAKPGIFSNSIKQVPLTALLNLKEIRSKCPSVNGIPCNCTLHTLEEYEKIYFHTTAVDCSSRGITELPKSLPPHTKVFNCSNNNITSLDGIGERSYNTIREFYANDNKIQSIMPLEGSNFLDSVNTLSLRHNRISRLDHYILSSVFDRNLGKTLYLAFNPLNCDCHTTNDTKVWILNNRIHIPDWNEIWCSNIANTRVAELQEDSVCYTNTDWKVYIHYVIAAEIVALVTLFGKLSYDYWVFKTAGYLPWPASKMPRMPWDFCLED